MPQIYRKKTVKNKRKMSGKLCRPTTTTRIANSTNLDAIKTVANLWHAFSNKVIIQTHTNTHPYTYTLIHIWGFFDMFYLLGFPFALWLEQFLVWSRHCYIFVLKIRKRQFLLFLIKMHTHFVAHNLVTIRAR